MINKLTLILVLLYFNCPAQSDSVLLNINQAIEDLLEEPEEENDDTELYELIAYYIEHPVDINKASVPDLVKVPFLDPEAAKLIVAHRDRYGTYFSANELYSIEGLPEGLTEKLLPFLSVGLPDDEEDKKPGEQHLPLRVNLRNRVTKDLQVRRGFKDSSFEGSPIKMYNRFTLEYDRYIRAGIITEKDAGERSYSDFLSGYVNLTDMYGFEDIILGDYQIKFGQGLALCNSYGVSKGSDAVFSSNKSASAIKPSTSAAENNFFRGAAFRYSWEHVDITGFYSGNRLDALVDSAGMISSISKDGLHRTFSESRKRQSVMEKAGGVMLGYTLSSMLETGVLYYHTGIDHSFIPSKIYDIEGNNFKYYSGYFDLFLNSFNIYGELAFNGKSNPAYLTGFILAPSTEFSYSLLIRNYPVDFNSIHGSVFGKRAGARNNEFGIYNGFRWRTTMGVLNLYFDQFKYPYAAYGDPLPSEGNEFMLRFTSRIFKNCEAGLRYKLGNKETAVVIDNEERMAKRHKQSLRLEYIYTVTSRLRLKTRFEYNFILLKDPLSREEGFLFYEDIRYMPLDGLLLYGRLIFFTTDSFNSAIYEYENDLAGILSSRGLYGEGARYYIAVRYNVFGKVFLSLKYAETFKPKESSLGSGYQQIEGSIDNRVGLQADINF